ncbi:unnamed protein product [marine sediment metagenome]|uniref:Uncharacterized protein n=1 Tax=marine sediment metagenome TaxID=412755 RepID=X1MAT6_9ZZZZ
MTSDIIVNIYMSLKKNQEKKENNSKYKKMSLKEFPDYDFLKINLLKYNKYSFIQNVSKN